MHPDRCAHPSAESAFKYVKQAYDTLTDADRRAEYDTELDLGRGNLQDGGYRVFQSRDNEDPFAAILEALRGRSTAFRLTVTVLVLLFTALMYVFVGGSPAYYLALYLGWNWSYLLWSTGASGFLMSFGLLFPLVMFGVHRARWLHRSPLVRSLVNRFGFLVVVAWHGYVLRRAGWSWWVTVPSLLGCFFSFTLLLQYCSDRPWARRTGAEDAAAGFPFEDADHTGAASSS